MALRDTGVLTNGVSRHENLPTFSASYKMLRICVPPLVLPYACNIFLHP